MSIGNGSANLDAIEAKMRKNRPDYTAPVVKDEIKEDIKEEEILKEKPQERRYPSVGEIDETDSTVSVEMTPGGTSMSTVDVNKEDSVDMNIPKSNKPKQSKAKAQQKKPKASDVTYIRDMPKSLVTEARAVFPSASNNTDALAAYVSLKSGNTEGLTDDQLFLVRNVKEKDPIQVMNSHLARLEKDIFKIFGTTKQLELVVGYLLFDRLGYRRENPNGPKDANLLEPGMEEMLDRIRTQADQYEKQENIRNGRPIR